MTTRRFELIEGSSKKFWEIALSGSVVRTRYGRIGASGQTTEKSGESPEAARVMFDKLVVEKTKKGYVEVLTEAQPEASAAVVVSEPAAPSGKKAPRAAGGPPGLLSAVKEKNLLAKLCGEEVEVHAAFIKASPDRNDLALFTDLITRKVLSFEHAAFLASLLRYAMHAEPTLLWDWLCGLPGPSAPLRGASGGCPLEDFVLEDVPLRLFFGVRAAWKRAPEVFDPGRAGAPGYLRDALLLVHAQAGRTIPEEDRSRLIERLAAQASRPHAIVDGFDRIEASDPWVRHVVSWLAQALGASRDDFAARVLAGAKPDALGRTLVALQWWESQPDGSAKLSFSPAIRSLPVEALVPAILEGRERVVVSPGFDEYGLERGRTVSAGLGSFALTKLLEAREDAAEALFARVDELEAAEAAREGAAARGVREVADLFTLVGHERDLQAARPVRPEWLLRVAGDHLLGERARALLPRLSADARVTLAEHDEEYPQHPFDRRFALVAVALAALPDARARVEAVIRRSRPRYGGDALLAMGRGLAAAMPTALDVLLEVRAHSEDVADASELRRRTLIVIGALAETARRGQPIPVTADVLVGPSELEAHPNHDWRHDLAGTTRDAYGEVFAGLPRERRRPLLAAWVAADTTGTLQIPEWLSAMPATVQADAPSAPSVAEILQRLVTAARTSADTTVYLLEPCNADETRPTLRAVSTLRGLSPEHTPKRKGTPLMHLVTFDFDAMPALRWVTRGTDGAPAFPDAAGVAIFLRSGGAWCEDNDDVEVVALSAEELAGAHEGGVPFRAIAVSVPSAVFVSASRSKDPALARIWDALRVPAGVALGAARRIQGDPETFGVERSFLFDADTRLLPINMGDAGVFHAYSFGGFLESC